jgi:F-type H+-transporting ATPase subunit alpha
VSRIGGRAQHPRIKSEAGRMKLDYLQFLELEVFTRFGARLEASMEAAIRRGRILRAALAQERLAPRSPAQVLAWLVALNDGHLDGLDPDDVPALLARLEEAAPASGLTLDSPREDWARWVAERMAGMPGREGDGAPPAQGEGAR